MLQLMQRTFATKLGYGAVALMVTAASLVGIIAPRSIDVAKAENCANAPTTAQFNIYPLTFDASTIECKDFPLIQMRKVNGGSYPTNLQEMQAGVTATAGDEIFGTVYIHNGAAQNLPQSQTVAKDVHITTIVDTNVGTTHQIEVRATSPNTPGVNQFYKITTGANEKLEVVPNSGERYDNNGNIQEAGFNMGNNILSIGDLNACFQYSRFYRFRVKVVPATPVAQGQLSITKEVRNVTANRTAFVNNETSYQNDTVEYRVKIAATDATPVNNVVITDALNSQLSYVNNSLMVNGQAKTGTLSSGVNLGAVNQSGVEIKYQAKVTASAGSTVTNTATAKGDGANQVQDSANVTVNTPQQQNTTITINKEVRNVTKNTSFAKSADAENGDQMQYRITVANTGSTTAKSVFVTDSLSNTGINPTGTINVDRSYTGSLANGLGLGDINTNSSVVITYTANVAKDSITVTNTAVATSSNASTVQSQAVVNVAVPSKGNLTITKQVRTLSGSFQDSVSVQNNEIVEYKIVVGVNSGNIKNITLTDSLPSGIQYQTGTLKIDGTNSGDNVSTISIGNLNNGQSKTVTFQAKAVAPANVAQTQLVNTAVAKGDNVTDVQDTATVIVNQVVGTPQLAVIKNVKNVTQGTSFQKSVSANNGDRVQFEITVSNPGSREVSNVRLTDNWSGALGFSPISVNGDFTASATNGFQISMGTLATGQQKKVYIDGTVSISGTGSYNLTNTAVVTGDSVSQVHDTATVNSTLVGQSNLVLSKKAWNDTKNVDATTTPASREDFITYTLTVNNTGSQVANNFVITDDLSSVLTFADMVDNGGGTISNNVITFPSVNVPANGSVTKSFKVRVKYSLAANLNFTMVNTYGNTVTVQIQTPAPVPPVVIPKTGGETNAIAFGGISTLGFAMYLKRKAIFKLIFA